KPEGYQSDRHPRKREKRKSDLPKREMGIEKMPRQDSARHGGGALDNEQTERRADEWKCAEHAEPAATKSNRAGNRERRDPASTPSSTKGMRPCSEQEGGDQQSIKIGSYRTQGSRCLRGTHRGKRKKQRREQGGKHRHN